MKTIAFYSYKGGVGRTLALSNIAMKLTEFGKKVCMLDLDMEAPGLHCKFNNYTLGDQKILQKGVVDYIYEFAVNHKLPSKLSNEYYCKLYSETKRNFSLTLIPAGNPESSEYWRKLSAINWYELLYGENAEGIKLFFDLKEKIAHDLAPDYLLIDTRTGITDISSLTISMLADQLVLLSANNEENISGCRRIVRSLIDPNNNILKKEKDIVLVLTRIPSAISAEDRVRENYIVNNFKERFSGLKYASGEEIVASPVVIHSDRKIECSEEFKIGYDAEIRNSQELISREYLELFGRITCNDFTSEEIKRFNQAKDKEKLYYVITKTESPIEAIHLIKEALKKYPKDDHLFSLLSINYFNSNDYNEALTNINKAITINPIFVYRNIRAQIYIALKEYKKSYDEVLDFKDKSLATFFTYCIGKSFLDFTPEEILSD